MNEVEQGDRARAPSGGRRRGQDAAHVAAADLSSGCQPHVCGRSPAHDPSTRLADALMAATAFFRSASVCSAVTATLQRGGAGARQDVQGRLGGRVRAGAQPRLARCAGHFFKDPQLSTHPPPSLHSAPDAGRRAAALQAAVPCPRHQHPLASQAVVGQALQQHVAGVVLKHSGANRGEAGQRGGLGSGREPKVVAASPPASRCPPHPTPRRCDTPTTRQLTFSGGGAGWRARCTRGDSTSPSPPTTASPGRAEAAARKAAALARRRASRRGPSASR